jgi:hypothetical protein
LHLSLDGKNVCEGGTRIFVVDPSPPLPRPLRVGLLGDPETLAGFLKHTSIAVEEFRAGISYDLLILLPDDKDPRWPDITDRLGEYFAAVKNGMPMLVLAQTARSADQAAKALAAAGAFQYAGRVGESRDCWMGNWVFVRDHAVFHGLPSNQVMKWEYQVAFEHATGLIVDGPGVEVFAGYGRDHDDVLGAATFTAHLEKGKVLFQAVRGMQPLLYERFIVNSMRLLTT